MAAAGGSSCEGTSAVASTDRRELTAALLGEVIKAFVEAVLEKVPAHVTSGVDAASAKKSKAEACAPYHYKTNKSLSNEQLHDFGISTAVETLLHFAGHLVSHLQFGLQVCVSPFRMHGTDAVVLSRLLFQGQRQK